MVVQSGVGWLVLGFRGLASLGPFLGAPAGSPGQVKYTGGTGSGAWHPLTPSWVPSSRWKWTVYEMARYCAIRNSSC